MTKYILIQECRIDLTDHATNIIYHINRLKQENHINIYGYVGEALDNIQKLFLLKILNKLEREGNSLNLLKGI